MTAFIHDRKGCRIRGRWNSSGAFSTDCPPVKSTVNRPPSLVSRFTREYLFLALIPFVSFFVCTVVGALTAERYLSELIYKSTHHLSDYARMQLETLGRQTIQDKAREVAAQVELFLVFNPDLAIQDLQKSEKFKSLAMQNVGLSGYTCLYEAGTGIMRMHPNAELIDRDMAFLSEELTSWWAIFEPSLARVEVSGYYDWMEPDGRVRSKYMTMTPVSVKFHGKTLMVAATTYIDEFSIPVQAMLARSEEVRKNYDGFITRQAAIIGSVMVTILLATLAVVFVFARRATRRFIHPIVDLAETAEGFGDGRWEIEEAAAILGRDDEIGVLARAFDRMRTQIKGQFENLKKNFARLKATQEAFKESESRFRTAFENASVGMALVSLKGTFLEVNLALARMIGYGPAEMIGKPVAEFTHPEDLNLRAQFIDDLVEGRITWGEQERRFLHRDGMVVWALIWASVQRDQNNLPLYFISLVQDITDRKRVDEEKAKLESRLIQAQKMEAIGALAGGIAHDFNNILAAITGYIELSLHGEDESAEYLRQGLNAANRAKDLVKQILVFSRQAHEEKMPVNVEMVVSEVMKFLRASVPTTINITSRIHGKPGAVLANSIELHQILMNLCTNAVHAIGGRSGSIEIETQGVEITPAERLTFPDLDAGRYIKLTVKDNGQGIPHEIRGRIFDPYFTTKEKGVGTGLGLSVVHGIVMKSNGGIRVESELGKGSVFSIYLPEVAMHSPGPAGQPDLPRGGSERILF